MVKTLDVVSQQSRHTTVMAQGLRALTIGQAENHISQMAGLISKCQKMSLKRLECEARLVHTCFHLVLRELGKPKSTDPDNENMQMAQNLCEKYPDTAGLLLPAYHNIKRSLTHTGVGVKTFCDPESQDIWWHWPEHHVGALDQCLNGHLYSSQKRPDCPECGREIKEPQDFTPLPLQDLEFMHAMKTLPASFDGAAYRH